MNSNLSRRERIAEMRSVHRRMKRRNEYVKMILAAVIVNQVLAWSLMIAVGVLHSGWWRTVPTMGYHTACLVTGLLFFGIVITILTARKLS